MATTPGSLYVIGFDAYEFDPAAVGAAPTALPDSVAVFVSRGLKDDPAMAFGTPVSPEPGRWLAEAVIPSTWIPGEEISVWGRATYGGKSVVRRIDRFAVDDPLGN